MVFVCCLSPVTGVFKWALEQPPPDPNYPAQLPDTLFLHTLCPPFPSGAIARSADQWREKRQHSGVQVVPFCYLPMLACALCCTFKAPSPENYCPYNCIKSPITHLSLFNSLPVLFDKEVCLRSSLFRCFYWWQVLCLEVFCRRTRGIVRYSEEGPGHHFSITWICLVMLYIERKTSRQKLIFKSKYHEPRISPSFTWIFMEATLRVFS